MQLSTILMLSVSLAMDAMAVSAVRGLAVPRIRWHHVARVAVFFGGFQALMPLIGWGLGAAAGPYVAAWDHWIAFVLLAGIGGNMIREGLAGPEEEVDQADGADPFGLRLMLLAAVATSIDAMAAGVTLPLLGAPMLLSLASIGVVTAALSAVGLFLGRRLGAAVGARLDLLGGIVLIGLGLRILVEHLTAGG